MISAIGPDTAGVGRRPSRLRGLIWVAWRQDRGTLLALAGLAVALAAVMLVAGWRGRVLAPALVRNHCLPSVSSGSTVITLSSTCGRLGTEFPGLAGFFGRTALVLTGNFVDYYPTDLMLALLALFLLTGMFLGAPLLGRELGQGTFRFAFTQGTGPVRWCATKLALLGGAVMAAGAGLGALAAWSLQPFDALGQTSRWETGRIETTLVTAAAWAVLAFALGAFGGTLFRRTVPAMAATLAGLGALLVVTFWKLNGLLLSFHPATAADNAQAEAAGLVTTTAKPVRLLAISLDPGIGQVSPGPPGSLPLRGWYVGPDGHRLTGAAATALINANRRSANQRHWPEWLSRHHDTFLVSYQPAGRYWLFQGVTGGALLLLALLLGAATVWLVSRRRP
jgi:hypothetical protein